MNESMSYELSQKLDQRGYKGQMALGYLDAINDLMKIEDRRYRDQPQLNENQQIVLEYLKRRFSEEPDIFKKSIFEPIDHLLYNFWDDNLNDAFYALDLKQESQVLQVFSQWALEQEAE